jgi:Tol biopolymer transport system component
MNISSVKEKSLQSNLSSNNSNFNNNSATTGLVFIDSKVDDYAILIAGITKNLEVVLLDDNCNGIAQITQALKGRFNLSSLHIVAHGEVGKLWLGNGFINSNTLEQYSEYLLSWGAALAPDADILLYGCKVAAGETGQQFVQLLSQLTGADVAASNNLTGSAALGGDWELEVKIGKVEAPIAFGAETLEAYSAVLTTRRISVASDGTQGNNGSSRPSISADGRYVAFVSSASNLVSGDTNGDNDIFVYDTVANATRRVSVGDNGTQGNSSSYLPSISADGRYVAFMSDASNLVSGDTNGTRDIFLYDTVSNTTRRVSVEGYVGSLISFFESLSISADGRYVAFASDASNLVSGDTNNATDIFVCDTVANTTRRVSVDSNGTQGNSGSLFPSISADGRYVAFQSDATNLVSDDTNRTRDIFVYDTVSNTTRRVSFVSNSYGDSSSRTPSISADGRYVAFDSDGGIFVYDTVANTTRPVSVNGYGYKPSISADGRYVTFYSDASNLVSGDTNNTFDVFVYDTVANTTRRVSVDSNGIQGNNNSYTTSISADGSYVAFYSEANNLVSGDTNGHGDIFVSNNPLAPNISSPDFNGDGKTDILWRNSATGQNVVWLMDGTNLTTGVALTPVADAFWNISGTGDFNGDSQEDILWRNETTGQNVVWQMDGTNLTTGVALTPVADVSWDISGTGDFNGDGQEDILWRNETTGQNVVWLMDGTNLTTGVELTPVADPNWSISGTGDFNGNGQEDILWRNSVTGQNVVWLMDGTQLATGVELTPVADANWSIGGTGDYNNDGQEDILWRNGATGQNVAWLMNGTQLATGVELTPVADSNWQIVA